MNSNREKLELEVQTTDATEYLEKKYAQYVRPRNKASTKSNGGREDVSPSSVGALANAEDPAE